MTIQELVASPEFQDWLKAEIKKQAPMEFKFEYSKGDPRDANTGEFPIDDDLEVEVEEAAPNVFSGSFSGTGCFEGNYIDSGRDSEHLPQSVEGSLSGQLTLELKSNLTTQSAQEILAGAMLDVEIDVWPKENGAHEDSL